MDRTRFINDSADSSGLIHRISTNVLARLFHKATSKFGGDPLLHENAFHSGATLTGIAVAAFGGECNGKIKIGIVENDKWVVSAELEHELFVAGGGRDVFSDGDAPGEGNKFDFGMP